MCACCATTSAYRALPAMRKPTLCDPHKKRRNLLIALYCTFFKAHGTNVHFTLGSTYGVLCAQSRYNNVFLLVFFFWADCAGAPHV